MSLLLDALNRASQDKAAAAAAASAAAATPKPGEMTLALDLPEPAPQVQPEPRSSAHASAPIAPPGDAWPTLGLALSSADATPVAGPSVGPSNTGGTLQPHDARLQLVAESKPTPTPTPAQTPAPQPSAPSPSPSEHRNEPTLVAPLPKFEQQSGTLSGKRPLPQDAPRVAQSIMRAKSPGPQAARPTRLIALLGIAVLLAAGLGSVLLGWWGDPMIWFQSATVAPPMAPPAAVAAAETPTTVTETIPTPAAAAQPTATVADQAPQQTPKSSPDALRPRARPSAAVVTTDTDRVRAGCAAGQSPAECEAANRPRKAAAPGKIIEPMLQTRSTGPSALEAGYAALIQGRLPEARQAYNQALARNPEERDALLGLAYIAHQQAHPEEARSYYQRVLRQDPGNAVARAGLLSLSPTGDAQELGSQSRDVAEQNPDSAAAQSVLGHSLVRQGRLAQAQLAFQRAHLLEPGVALHAFNLAVALDRLRRYPLARHYYEQALSLSAQTGGERISRLPLAVVQERLFQLQADIPANSPHEQ